MKVSLKAMRVHRELTQKEVAERLNVSVDRIKYLEGEGENTISYKDVVALCSIYNCSLDDIDLPATDQ